MVRVRQGGATTDVYLNLLADGSIMHHSANLKVNGWETDAYLTAARFRQKRVMTKVEGARKRFGNASEQVCPRAAAAVQPRQGRFGPLFDLRVHACGLRIGPESPDRDPGGDGKALHPVPRHTAGR